MPLNIRDALLTVSKALSNGAGTVTSDGIDLGLTSRSDFVARAELLIEAPALTTTLLPDTETMKYSLYHDSDPAFGTETVLDTDALVQTGAGGAGAVAATKRVGIPSDVKAYVRFKAVKTGTGNASTVSGKLSVMF